MVKKNKEPKIKYITVGAAVGAVLGNLPVGIAIGVAIGADYDAVNSRKKK